jgi:membrane protease YdiL (CAAX protease family)
MLPLVLCYFLFVRTAEHRRCPEMALSAIGLGELVLGLGSFVLWAALTGSGWTRWLEADSAYWIDMVLFCGVFVPVAWGIIFRYAELIVGSIGAVVVASTAYVAYLLWAASEVSPGLVASAVAVGLLLSAAYVQTRRLWLGIGLCAGTELFSDRLHLMLGGSASVPASSLLVALAIVTAATGLLLGLAVHRRRVVSAGRAWSIQTGPAGEHADGDSAATRDGERFSLWGILGVALLVYWVGAYHDLWWWLAIPVIYWAFARFCERRRLVELRGGARGVLELVSGVVAAFVMVLLAWLAASGTGPHLPLLAPPFVIQFAIVALCEEMIFRGLLLRGIDRAVGSLWALTVVSVLFGLVHHYAGPLHLVDHILAGALLGAAYLCTRRLWLSVGLHLGMNLAVTAVGSGMLLGGYLIAFQAAATVLLLVVAAKRGRLTRNSQSSLAQLRRLRWPHRRSHGVSAT